VDPTGHTLVTGAADRQIKVWDLRMMQERHSYYSAAGVPTSLDISQRGLLGVGHAGHVTVWNAEALQKKVRDPYMHHMIPGASPIETLRFRPFEDVCGIGHYKGISSIVIPGAGEATVDTAEFNINPMQDTKQRQEQEVRALLDKLQPAMIGMDADQVGGMEESDPHRRLERIQQLQEDANAEIAPKKKQKTKKRGRSKIQTKLRRKQANIIDKNVMQLRQAREKEKAATVAARQGQEVAPSRRESAPTALRRFF
jgi:U3 small nucleolar RNA-associated protein 7